ncbi:MAG: D-cysteine desulfhydrase family protein [Calditrichaeota bacterium]|nr:D-cysteine desulfhydrase family protein [Calditrichota bacterium]
MAHTPTPLERLSRLSRLCGGDIWVKRDDLTGLGLSGNKVRKLEVLFAEAVEKGADTVITCGGAQSNHCRATAVAAARLAMKCILVLRQSETRVPDGNLFIDKLVGADIVYITGQDYKLHLNECLTAQAEQARAAGRVPYIIPEGGSNPLGALGMLECMLELQKQCAKLKLFPRRIVAASGSGGTHAGLYVAARLLNWDIDVVSIAVCYDGKETRRRIAEIVQGMIELRNMNFTLGEDDILVIDRYLGAGYAQAGAVEFEIIKETAQNEGLLLDPVYTGKAMHGIKAETLAGRMPGATIFYHSGGVFGLFPFKERFWD